MCMVEEQKNSTNITRYYKIDVVRNREDAVRWLSNVRSLSGMTTNYLYFSDMLNRMDEGSNSIQMDAMVNLSDMEQYVRDKSIDLILLNGKYNDKPIVVGVDLSENLVYLTIRKKTPADIVALEKVLCLV